jgi:hypothetical protein
LDSKPESRDELRERLRGMSDLELRRFGQQARKVSDPKMNFGATHPTSFSWTRRGRSGEGDTLQNEISVGLRVSGATRHNPFPDRGCEDRRKSGKQLKRCAFADASCVL